MEIFSMQKNQIEIGLLKGSRRKFGGGRMQNMVFSPTAVSMCMVATYGAHHFQFMVVRRVI